MNWTRLPVNDGSGEVLIGEASTRTLRVRLGGSSPAYLSAHKGSLAAWELAEWLLERQPENFSCETSPPNRRRRLSSREVVRLVGDEHSDWVKEAIVRSLRRLRVLQEGSNANAVDEEFARSAAAAETRLLRDAHTAWPEDPELRPTGCDAELLTAKFRADLAEFVAGVSGRSSSTIFTAADDAEPSSIEREHARDTVPASLPADSGCADDRTRRATATSALAGRWSADLRRRIQKAPLPRIVMFVGLAVAAGSVTAALAGPIVTTKTTNAPSARVRLFLVQTFHGRPKVTRLRRFNITPTSGAAREEYEDGHSAHAVAESTYKLIASIEEKMQSTGRHRHSSKGTPPAAPRARIRVVTWQGESPLHTRASAPASVAGGDNKSSMSITSESAAASSREDSSPANSTESLVIVEGGGNATFNNSTPSGSPAGG
jgi:hypothetical protein